MKDLKRKIRKACKSIIDHEIHNDKMFVDAMDDDDERYLEACNNFRVYPLLNIAVIVAKNAREDVCKMQVYRFVREALKGLHKAPYRGMHSVKVIADIIQEVNGRFEFKLEYPGFESNEFDYDEFVLNNEKEEI